VVWRSSAEATGASILIVDLYNKFVTMRPVASEPSSFSDGTPVVEARVIVPS
jgi:hypothetical protein